MARRVCECGRNRAHLGTAAKVSRNGARLCATHQPQHVEIHCGFGRIPCAQSCEAAAAGLRHSRAPGACQDAPDDIGRREKSIRPSTNGLECLRGESGSSNEAQNERLALRAPLSASAASFHCADCRFLRTGKAASRICKIGGHKRANVHGAGDGSGN